METLLSISNLSKCYATYHSNLERFAGWFGAPVKAREEFWPVKDISFALRRGEALAIVGQNGAGKSTLLKLITGTVRPTKGTVNVLGKISAILELGLGFNPEFTGRQNIYHAGGLMGLSERRLTELMPEIQEFTEIGEFFDQPFRIYSSGMQARLAFALATAERPDVLIVDEVLSVGDSYFQHKSFDQIRRFKNEGTSIILVTHSMGDVRSLCDRVILIDKGSVLKDGPPDEVVDYYNAMVAAKENAKLSIEQRREKNNWLYSRSGSGTASISSVTLRDSETRSVMSTARVGQNLTLDMALNVKEDIPELVVGLMIKDRTGHVVWGTNTWHTNQAMLNLKAGTRLDCALNFCCDLGPGSYGISIALHTGSVHIDENYDWIDNIDVFDVVNIGHPFFVGTGFLDYKFEVPQ